MQPLVLKGSERNITIIRFNYDGDIFFSGSAQSKICLWESYTGEKLGTYQTRAAVRSLDVDLNSENLISCSNDGSLQVFQVKTGNSKKYTRLPYKLKQVEFNLGSSKFFILLDQFKSNVPTKIKVFNFSKFLNTNFPQNEDERAKVEETCRDFEFQTLLPEEKNPIKLSTRALWYIDNTTFFVATNDGWIIHYDEKGAIKNKAIIHESTKINSIAFSKDFSVLGTAADNGCKILDPQTLNVIRYFKQELPMNAISISPLFCSAFNPKYHMVMGGGVSAIMAAESRSAGFQAHVCNIMHNNEIGKISGHFGPINSMQFFRDGRGFISGGQEGIIRIIRFGEEYFEEGNPIYE